MSIMPYTFPETATAVRYPIEAFIYVLRFKSGLVKVGYSADPAERVRQHQKLAESYDNSVTAQWVSKPHAMASENEKSLISFCTARATAVVGREYFRGVDFDVVVGFAESLPFRRATAAEIEALEARTEEAKKAFQLLLRPLQGKRVIEMPQQLDVAQLSELPAGGAADAVVLLAELLGISEAEAEALPHEVQMRVVGFTAEFWNANQDVEVFAGLLRKAEQDKSRLLRDGLATLRQDIAALVSGGAR